MIPTIKVRVKTYRRYCSAVDAVKAAIPAAVNMEMIASGPTAKCLELPNRAYSRRGTVTAYNPCTGSSPASIAYAIACGISIIPTVNPAERSPGKSPLLYWGSHSRIGRNFVSILIGLLLIELIQKVQYPKL